MLSLAARQGKPRLATMPPPAAVVFDNDGLTLDTEIVWTRAEETLFARRGRTFTHAHKIDLVGSAGHVAAAKLARMLDAPEHDGPAILLELQELVMEELAQGCAPMPGAVALLDALQAEGVPIGLCSNSPRRFVDLALTGSGLDGRFAVTIAGDEVDRQKPDPEPYLAACAALGAEPGACVALEDSPTGCRSARAAGLYVLGVPSVPGVALAGLAHELHASLSEPALWAALRLEP